MTIATYDDLKAAVPNWLRRTDLAEAIPDFVALAEADMNRELRTSWQLVKANGTLDAEFVGMPGSFRMMRSLRLTSGSGQQLREVTPEELARRKAVPQILVAEPREFAVIGGQLELWPVPDRAYAAAMEYQQGFLALSDGNPTNWILRDHPDAYLYGTLAAGSAYLKNDERAAGFQAQFLRVIGAIQEALRTSYDRTLRTDPALVQRQGALSNDIHRG